MRILHTIGRLTSSAIDGDILTTATWQQAEGWHVVLAAPSRTAILERGVAAGLVVEATEMDHQCGGRQALMLRNLVRRHAIEIIHAHDEAGSLQALMCADLCPIVRTLGDDEVARLMASTVGLPAVNLDASGVEAGLPYDHLIVESAGSRAGLIEAELVAPEHVSEIAGPTETCRGGLLESYERAIIRAMTGRAIPARFVGGPPDLHRLGRWRSLNEARA